VEKAVLRRNIRNEAAQQQPVAALNNANTCRLCGDPGVLSEQCANGHAVCATCLLTWMRNDDPPSCPSCGMELSEGALEEVIAESRALGGVGDARPVSADEARRLRGEAAAGAFAPSAPAPEQDARTRRRLRRDIGREKDLIAELGAKPCPRCGTAVKHVRNDGCHEVRCSVCKAGFCFVCLKGGGDDDECDCPSYCDATCNCVEDMSQ